MDGNGRWANARGLPRIFGHRAGAAAVRRTVEASCELGIAALTLYAFSWENWNRPPQEINDLMGLLDEFLSKEEPTMHKNHVRLRAIGRVKELPARTMEHLQAVIAKTASYDRLTLTLALSYGGRQEIVDAARRLAELVHTGRLAPEQIDEALFSQQLYTAGTPDPDLVIRTSGEQRLSNFLLWQTSYAEFYVTPKPWPEFAKADLLDAIAEFERRERRFGKAVTPQGTAVR
jgi:undecaprenyl diphosphate synthase